MREESLAPVGVGLFRYKNPIRPNRHIAFARLDLFNGRLVLPLTDFNAVSVRFGSVIGQKSLDRYAYFSYQLPN